MSYTALLKVEPSFQASKLQLAPNSLSARRVAAVLFRSDVQAEKYSCILGIHHVPVARCTDEIRLAMDGVSNRPEQNRQREGIGL